MHKYAPTAEVEQRLASLEHAVGELAVILHQIVVDLTPFDDDPAEQLLEVAA